MQKKYIPVTILVVLPLSILAIYFPGLSGGFVFDDFSNIVLSPGIAIQEFTWENVKNAALSMDGRPIARASFGINYLAAGLDPFYFKLVNILIHSINSMLVFALVMLIVKQQLKTTQLENIESKTLFISAAIAFAWALHPVNLTNVLYSVQRMNSMSATFVLAGILSYACGRLSLDSSPLKSWLLISASIVVFLPLAWFSKENGALLPLFLFVLELSIFRFSTADKHSKKWLYVFFTFFLLIPTILGLFYLVQHYGFFQRGYANRHFSLTERLLTEPRVIWLYIRMILLPAPNLYSLFLDDIVVSQSLLEPVATTFAIVGLTGLLALALFSVRRIPILGFGLLFFFSGHLMESTVIPLELAFEHRNYLPSLGLLIPVFYAIGFAGQPGSYQKSRLVFISAIVLLLATYTHIRSWQWSDNVRLYLTEVQYHPDSVRANYEAGKVFGQRLERREGDPQLNYREAIKYFERVTRLQNNSTSGLFGSILASIDTDHPINPEWINELANRFRNQPLEQVSILWLDKLTDCVSGGKCQKNRVRVPYLLNAALSYKGLNHRNKALLYTVLAKYFFTVERNHTKAIKYGKIAISADRTNLYYQLNLAKYQISSGDHSSAIKTLDKMSSLDINNQHAAAISRLRKIAE